MKEYICEMTRDHDGTWTTVIISDSEPNKDQMIGEFIKLGVNYFSNRSECRVIGQVK